jgi:outer membrane lipoprotein-sorting protein
MNPLTPSPTEPDDFDSPPEQELTALFAASPPPARPVNVDALFPEAVAPASIHSRTYSFNRRSPMFRRIAILASATAGIAVVAALFVLFGSTAQLTFAEVAEKVAKTRSVTMKQALPISSNRVDILQITFLADGRRRMDMPNGDYTIADADGNSLCVSPGKKSARFMHGLNTPPINLYEMVRNIVSEKSKRLPDETLNGRKTSVFQADMDKRIRTQFSTPAPPMKVWVDSETRLPIRVEQGTVDEKVVTYDIVFDQPVDSSRFSLTPPEGYAVTTIGEPATWQQKPPAEKDMLAPEVVPGVGLGPAKFGMSNEEIIKLLGKADSEEKGSLQYPSRGYACMVSPKRGLVAISFFSQRMCAFKVRDFAGKTKQGVGIGSSLKDLEKAFAKPTAVEANGPETNYVRFTELGLDFTLFNDKVVGFLMQRVR